LVKKTYLGDKGGGRRMTVQNQDLINELIKLNAVERGDFVLASGKKSDYYVNIKRATTSPLFLKLVAKQMAPLVGDAQRIAGVELGAVPIAVAVALELGTPFIVVRKAKKEHGTKARIEGAVEKGDKVVFVEDVTTTANTLKNAILMVRDLGAVVEKALCVVDRNEGAVENLKSIDAQLVPLVDITEVLQKVPL